MDALTRELSRLNLDLARTCRESELDEEATDAYEWVAANREINGKPWSWNSPGPKMELGRHDRDDGRLERPYMRGYINDESPIKNAIKPRQSEFTEVTFCEGLRYCCTRPGTKCEHIFPIESLAMAKGREQVGPGIKDSPKIARLLVSSAVSLNMFRGGSLYSTSGALSRAGGRGNTRDWLLYDEWDFMEQGIEGVFDEMMSHSSLALKRKISTPTTPGTGIDLAYQEGCGYRWLWKCSCGHEQEWSWPESCINYFELGSLDVGSKAHRKKLYEVYWGCKRCKKPVDRNGAAYLESATWVASREDLVGEIASYSVTAAMIAWKTAREVLRKCHALREYSSTFFNEVWGIAHVKGAAALSADDVAACRRDWSPIPKRPSNIGLVSAGIDQGETESWVVISARGMEPADPSLRCVVKAIRIDRDFLVKYNLANHPLAHAEAERMICAHYRCEIIVCDANQLGSDRFSYLRDAFPEQVWGAFFDTHEKMRQLRTSKLLVPKWSSDWTVTFSKVYLLKEVQSDIRNRRVGLPSPQNDVDYEFEKQQLSLAVQERLDLARGLKYEVAAKLSTQDHFLDAHMYSKIGFERLAGVGHGPLMIGPTGVAV